MSFHSISFHTRGVIRHRRHCILSYGQLRIDSSIIAVDKRLVLWTKFPRPRMLGGDVSGVLKSERAIGTEKGRLPSSGQRARCARKLVILVYFARIPAERPGAGEPFPDGSGTRFLHDTTGLGFLTLYADRRWNATEFCSANVNETIGCQSRPLCEFPH